MLPVERLIDQRDHVCTAATEQNGRDRHTVGMLPLRRDRWALVCGRREARVGMRRLGDTLGRPGLTLPVQRRERRRAIHAFPIWRVVGRQGHIRKDRILPNGRHDVGVGTRVRARGHAEETGLGVDRPQAAIGSRVHPGNILTHCPHLVALLT